MAGIKRGLRCENLAPRQANAITHNTRVFNMALRAKIKIYKLFHFLPFRFKMVCICLGGKEDKNDANKYNCMFLPIPN